MSKLLPHLALCVCSELRFVLAREMFNAKFPVRTLHAVKDIKLSEEARKDSLKSSINFGSARM